MHDSWQSFRGALARLPSVTDDGRGDGGWEIHPSSICTFCPDGSSEVEARLGADGRFESATLVVSRRQLTATDLRGAPNTALRQRLLDLIAQFLVAFPGRSPTRVRLACTVGALLAPGSVLPEVAADAPGRPRLFFGQVDEPQEAMLEVVAGRRWDAETARLELANWHSGQASLLKVRAFARGRFKYGRWSHEARVPWAEELWAPHPSDGDGVAVRVRRTVAACCVGEQTPEAAARALIAARPSIAHDDPLQSFVASALATLASWATGAIGAAHGLYELGTALDHGSGTAWPSTLRERMRKRVPLEWVPVQWAAEALEVTNGQQPKDLRSLARAAITLAIIAEPNGSPAVDAAERLLGELRALLADSKTDEAVRLRDQLATAERATTSYLDGRTTFEELTDDLQEVLGQLNEPPDG